jgi:hypothetical protein
MKTLLLALGLVSTIALAQDKVYRCGPDGRSYSATPCPEGREVNVADPRSDTQRRAAFDAAQRESRLARQLGRERLQRDRARPAGAASLGTARPRDDAASGPRQRQSSKDKKDKADRQTAGTHKAGKQLGRVVTEPGPGLRSPQPSGR